MQSRSTTTLDPLSLAQIEAAQLCAAVTRQAKHVADTRQFLEGLERDLEGAVERAEKAVSDVRAMQAIRGGIVGADPTFRATAKIGPNPAKTA